MRTVIATLLLLTLPPIAAVAKDYGDLPIDYLLPIIAQTYNSSTGAAEDLEDPPWYAVYEQGAGTQILGGEFALLDDANTEGFYSVVLTLSAANGFEVNKHYVVRVTPTEDPPHADAALHYFSVSAARTNASLAATQTDPAAIRSAVGLTAANINAQFSGLGASLSTAITQTTAPNIRAAMGLAAADLDTQLGAIDTAAGLAATQTDAAAIRTSLGLAAADLDTQLDASLAQTDPAAIRSAVGLTAANLNAQFSGLGASLGTAIAQTTAANLRGAVGLSAADLDTQIDLLSTNIATVDTQTDAATIRSVVGLAAADLDTQLGNLGTDVASIDALLGTPAGASLAADLASLTTDVGSIEGGPITNNVTNLVQGIPGGVIVSTADSKTTPLPKANQSHRISFDVAAAATAVGRTADEIDTVEVVIKTGRATGEVWRQDTDGAYVTVNADGTGYYDLRPEDFTKYDGDLRAGVAYYVIFNVTLDGDSIPREIDSIHRLRFADDQD